MRIAAGRLIASILRVARAEIGALAALLILAGGVLAFFDIAEDSSQPARISRAARAPISARATRSMEAMRRPAAILMGDLWGGELGKG